MESTYQGRRSRRSFSEQYKAEVVALCQGSEKSLSEIARHRDHSSRFCSAVNPGLPICAIVPPPGRHKTIVGVASIGGTHHGFFRQGDPVNVYPFIEAERVARAGSVRRACALLKVSRAAYYAWSAQGPCRHTLADEELLERIVAAHKASRGTYGSPRITRALRAAGLRVGRKRVARLMALRGLVGRAKRRRKRTTIADPAASGRATDLLQRDFAPEAHEIDTLWCGDISYVRTWEGWAYVATVIDLASRRVVGVALSDHVRASLAAEALTMALTQRRPAPGLVFHSDRGCQYTSAEFRGLLARHGPVQSLSRPGQCWDNAVAERFFSNLKAELLYRGVWPTRAAARRAIFEYVEVFYNRQRMHSTLGYLTPVAYEARRRDLTATQAAQAA